MGLFSNKIGRAELKRGDHIYSWVKGPVYAHHGIYVGNGTVIDYTGEGVVKSSSLDSFLSGGHLYRFEYGVTKAFFVAKIKGGTCTTATSDPPEAVVQRAEYLLQKGFGNYNVFNNNCEDFAIYCKTGLLVMPNKSSVGQSGQVASYAAAAFASLPLIFNIPMLSAMPIFFGVVPIAGACLFSISFGFIFYCGGRLNSDIGARPDVHRVHVEEL